MPWKPAEVKSPFLRCSNPSIRVSDDQIFIPYCRTDGLPIRPLMSFVDQVQAVLKQAESALCALMADALKAHEYGEIGTIAIMAESLSAIKPEVTEART